MAKLVLFLVLGLFARADEVASPALGGEELRRNEIENQCKRDLQTTEECCLKGSCQTEGLTNYALVVDAEEIRPLRQVCLSLRGEKPLRCPGGKHLTQKTYFLMGGEASDPKASDSAQRLTRLALFSARPEVSSKQGDEATLELIKLHRKICLATLDEMRGGKGRDSTFFQTCDQKVFRPMVDELREKVHFELSDLVVNPKRRRMSGGAYEDKYLQTFLANSCPTVTSWNGVFKQEQLTPMAGLSPQIKAELDELIRREWGVLSKSEHEMLRSRECIHQETIRLKCSAQPVAELTTRIPCDGQIHVATQRTGPSPSGSTGELTSSPQTAK